MAQSIADHLTARMVEARRKLGEIPEGSPKWAEAWMGARSAEAEAIQAAVDRGIADGEVEARRRGTARLTGLEREAINFVAVWPADHIADTERSGAGEVNPRALLEMVERFACTLAGNPLLRKALAAWWAEETIMEDPPASGVLGTALDGVIKLLAPYRRPA